MLLDERLRALERAAQRGVYDADAWLEMRVALSDVVGMLGDEHDRATPCNLLLQAGDRRCVICEFIGRAPAPGPEATGR